jgi:hypothetical protein
MVMCNYMRRLPDAGWKCCGPPCAGLPDEVSTPVIHNGSNHGKKENTSPIVNTAQGHHNAGGDPYPKVTLAVTISWVSSGAHVALPQMEGPPMGSIPIKLPQLRASDSHC